MGIWWEEYSRQWVSKCKGPGVGTRLVCLRKIQKSEEGGERARAPEEALVNPGDSDFILNKRRSPRHSVI